MKRGIHTETLIIIILVIIITALLYLGLRALFAKMGILT